MNYDQEIERQGHPENFMSEDDMLLSTDWQATRRQVLSSWTIEQLQNEFVLMDVQERLSEVDELTQKSWDVANYELDNDPIVDYSYAV